MTRIQLWVILNILGEEIINCIKRLFQMYMSGFTKLLTLVNYLGTHTFLYMMRKASANSTNTVLYKQVCTEKMKEIYEITKKQQNCPNVVVEHSIRLMIRSCKEIKPNYSILNTGMRKLLKARYNDTRC